MSEAKQSVAIATAILTKQINSLKAEVEELKNPKPVEYNGIIIRKTTLTEYTFMSEALGEDVTYVSLEECKAQIETEITWR